jgi:glycosyltransferase involved in cell wall biosynthesis
MKALLFTNHYPASDAPTRGTYNQNTFGALARRSDWELRVVGPVPWWTRTRKPRDLVLVQRESKFGLDAAFPSYLSIPGVGALHARGVYLSLYPYMKLVRRAFPYDLMIASWGYPDAVAAARFADDAGVPLITNVLGSDVNEQPKDPALRGQIIRGFKRAQRIVAVSRAMGDALVELGVARERVVVQHNGVDGAKFAIRDKAEARARLGIEHRGPVVVYVGNVKIGKGVKVLVDAVSPLTRRLGKSDVLVCVVGSGEDQAEIAARVRELGVEKNVRLAGRQLHTDVPWWISAGDVFCLPSYMEGCPNVVLEALASGRGVVATRVGGIPEIVSDRTGILVPPGDAEALADGLAAALDRSWDPEAQRASVQYLSWDAVGDTYRGLLDEVMAEWRAGKR